MLQVQLPRAVTAGRRARALLADFLPDDSTDEVAIAQLLTDELVNNALEHGRGAIIVSASFDGGSLRVGVFDESPERPLLRTATAHEAHGRGLCLVNRLAASWGVDEGPDIGKTVWFELSLHRTGEELLEAGDLEDSSDEGRG